MFRERGHCSDCQAALAKITNRSRNRRCESCSAALGRGRRAYHCETCSRFVCMQCTNASRGSNVHAYPAPPRREQRTCGTCQALLVRFAASATHGPCHGCSASLEYHRFAYRCERCKRMVCTKCTSINLNRSAKRRISPVRGLRGPVRCSCCSCHRKRLRLSPAGGTAGADEHERAQMADIHERAQIRYALDIYREARAQIRDASTSGCRSEMHDRWLSMSGQVASTVVMDPY